jgi:hypothetical protein
LFFIDTHHLSFENTVDFQERSALFSQLLGKVGLAFENALKIKPLALYLDQKFQSFCDACDVVFPEIYFLVELLVVG